MKVLFLQYLLSIFFLFIYFNPQASSDPSLSGPNWDWGHPVVDRKFYVKARSLFLLSFTPRWSAALFLWDPQSFSLAAQILPLELSSILLCRSLGPICGLEGLQGVWVGVTQVPGPSPNSCFYCKDPTRCQLCCIPAHRITPLLQPLLQPLVCDCFWNTVLDLVLAVFSLIMLPFL